MPAGAASAGDAHRARPREAGDGRRAPVGNQNQQRLSRAKEDHADPLEIARDGVRAREHETALPHRHALQALFGRHDLSRVTAHVDERAATASARLGAHAYALGRQVAFADASPDLRLAAHEAAHVVQQEAGLNVEEADFERHADQVAELVAQGKSAEPLLDRLARRGRSIGSAPGRPALQLKRADKPPAKAPPAPRTTNLVATQQLVDFGESEIGLMSGVRSIRVTNQGTESIDTVQLERLGPNGAQFVAWMDESFCIAPGASFDLKVAFLPDAFGNRSCLLRLFSDEPGAETFVMVRGIGMNDTWRRMIQRYGDVVAGTGHGYQKGDASFYRFLAMGNTNLGHNEPPVFRDEAALIENSYGFPHVKTDEELAQEAAQRKADDEKYGPFVPPAPLHMDSQGRVGTAEQLHALHFTEAIMAMDNLKSLGGVVGYGVSGIWTDDPMKRMQWAALGNTVGNVAGAYASPYLNRMGPSGPVETYSTYDSGKSNVQTVGRGGELLPTPAALVPAPTLVATGTVRSSATDPTVISSSVTEVVPPEIVAPEVVPPEVVPPQSAPRTPAAPPAAAKPQLALKAGNPGIGGVLSNESLNLIERTYGAPIRRQVEGAQTQADLDRIGRQLGTQRDEFLATLTERASVDLRRYAGNLAVRGRGTGTTPGTDLLQVTARGVPEITPVEVKVGASRSPYRQGASSMPNAYRMEEVLHREIWSVIRDKTQPVQLRARLKMALDAGTPINWELDAYGNVRLKMRGNDAFPQDVEVFVPIVVPP